MARAATLVRQPYLQNVRTDRASILWTTNAASSGTVTITDPDGGSTTVAASMQVFDTADTQMAAAFYQYQADFTGLLPATQYTYRVTVDGKDLVSDPLEYLFETAGPGKFSFLVFGDSGADSSQQAALVKLMSAEPNIAMMLQVGDLAYPDGSFANFESGHYAPNAPLMRRLSLFSTPGNHEYNTGYAAPYLAGVALPDANIPSEDKGRYYSFDWSNTHFASLDSNLLLTSSASQVLAWFENDLATTQKHWRIVFLHHPPYPTGFHLGDPVCAAVQQLVVPIVERYGVQLVLSGHEHGYERSYPLSAGVPVQPPAPSTTYVISGGGGGALESVGTLPQCALSAEVFHYLRVDVSANALHVRAIGLGGVEIDSFLLGNSATPAIQRVSSAGGLTPAVAAGSLVCITGEELATRTVAGSNRAAAAELGDVIVTVDGVVAPLLSVSPTEINAQLPYHVSGPATLRVMTPNGNTSTNVTVLPVAPSLLAVRSANRPLHFCNPVRPGALVRLYVTGLGAAEKPEGLEVWLGKSRLEVSGTALEPGRVGVHRVEVTVPASLPDGLYALQITAGVAGSRPVNVDVSASASTAGNDRACLQVETVPSR